MRLFEINMHISLRNKHSKSLAPKFACVDVLKIPFFYSVVPKWNSLPGHVANKQIQILSSTCARHVSQGIVLLRVSQTFLSISVSLNMLIVRIMIASCIFKGLCIEIKIIYSVIYYV